jgi:tetratricopeptide (TPR) repeat protein
MGAYAKAESLFNQVLRIQQKALRSEHPATATSLNEAATDLNNLAVLYHRMGAFAKAEPLYQQALQIRKALGPEHPETAESLGNLAGLYHAMGAYAKAEPLYQQALQIKQKTLGPNHPDTAGTLENLAWLKLDLGQTFEATSLALQSAQARLAILSKVLSFTSEQQRLACQHTFKPYDLFAILQGSEGDIVKSCVREAGASSLNSVR